MASIFVFSDYKECKYSPRAMNVGSSPWNFPIKKFKTNVQEVSWIPNFCRVLKILKRDTCSVHVPNSYEISSYTLNFHFSEPFFRRVTNCLKVESKKIFANSQFKMILILTGLLFSSQLDRTFLCVRVCVCVCVCKRKRERVVFTTHIYIY